MIPLRGSATATPVERSTPRMPKLVRSGLAWRMSANAPAAAGAEAEVPPKLETFRPPFPIVLHNPGASSERFVFESEKQVTRSGVTGWSVQKSVPTDQLRDTAEIG